MFFDQIVIFDQLKRCITAVVYADISNEDGSSIEKIYEEIGAWRKMLCHAGIALRREAGTLCRAGRATLRNQRATSARNDERAWTRNLGSTIFFNTTQ